MLYWAAMFLIIALIAAFFGFARRGDCGGWNCENSVLHLPGRLSCDPDFGGRPSRHARVSGTRFEANRPLNSFLS